MLNRALNCLDSPLQGQSTTNQKGIKPWWLGPLERSDLNGTQCKLNL